MKKSLIILGLLASLLIPAKAFAQAGLVVDEASYIITDTSNFGYLLATNPTTVQAALDALDDAIVYHATDCTAVTGAVEPSLCIEIDSYNLYYCNPTVGTCDTAGEWHQILGTLTQEQVEDFVGAMFTGNTETLVTITYQDGDGTIDVVVDNDLGNYDATNLSITAGTISDLSAGTDITADLEEETHASEHAENAADELFVENLGTACTTNQVFKSDGSGGINCGSDNTGGGGGGSTNIQEGGVDVVTPAATVNMDADDFNVTNPSGSTALITLGDEPTVDGLAVADHITFSATGSKSHTAGMMYYSSTNYLPEFFNNETEVELQIGAELWVRAYNGTGSTITNGSVVYVSGTQAEGTNNRPTIALAQADDPTTSKVLGIATHDIETTTYGWVTHFGNINDLNTSSFSDGDRLWLSATVAGGFTASEPQSPNQSVFIGEVIKSDASAGTVFLSVIGNTGGESGDATQLTIPVRKGSAGTITKGQAVYISGYNVGQSVVEVELADADGSGTYPAIGLANESITNAANGTVIVSGRIANVATNTYTVNDPVYLSTSAGGLTSTRPTGTNDCIQSIGRVARSNASNGVIQIFGAGRCNDESNSIDPDRLTGDTVDDNLIDLGLIDQTALSITESQISDLTHTTDTNANTVCTGTTTYLDGEGNCDDISSVYESATSNDFDPDRLAGDTTDDNLIDAGVIEQTGLSITLSQISDYSAGAGDVTAASNFSTDNVLIKSDGTGKGVQATGISVTDGDVVTGVEQITVATTLTIGSATITYNGATSQLDVSHIINILAGGDAITFSNSGKLKGATTTDAVIISAPGSAVADGELDNGQWTMWIDASNDEFELKGKDSAGDVVNITIGSASFSTLDADYGNETVTSTWDLSGATLTIPTTITANGASFTWGSVAGTVATLGDITGGGTAAGSDTQVQFNDGGSAFGGDAGLTYNKTSDKLTVAGTVAGDSIDIGSGTCLRATGDRVYHDTDCDGTKDAGEEFIDLSNTAAGSDTNSPKLYSWDASSFDVLSISDTTATIGTDTGTNLPIRIFNFNDSYTTCLATGAFEVPSDMTSGGTANFEATWYSGSATSGNVIWSFYHNSGIAEGATWDASLTTETASADAVQGTVDQDTETAWSETLSNLGWVAGDSVNGFICREGENGSDTMTGNAALREFTIEIPRE